MSMFSFWVIFSLFFLKIVCFSEESFPFVEKEPPSKEEFNMKINEQGSKFTERVTFDMKKKTVVHYVPAHRNVSESEVMIDFATNLTITRMLTERVCYIRPIFDEESFEILKNGMDTVATGKLNVKTGFQSIKTFWRVKGVADRTKLSNDIVDFCRDWGIYNVEKFEYDAAKIIKAAVPRRKRRFIPMLDNWGMDSCFTTTCYRDVTCTDEPRKCTNNHRANTVNFC